MSYDADYCDFDYELDDLAGQASEAQAEAEAGWVWALIEHPIRAHLDHHLQKYGTEWASWDPEDLYDDALGEISPSTWERFDDVEAMVMSIVCQLLGVEDREPPEPSDLMSEDALMRAERQQMGICG